MTPTGEKAVWLQQESVSARVGEGLVRVVGSLPTKAPVQSKKQLADTEGDGGVSRDDDGLVSTFGISAVIDLKL